MLLEEPLFWGWITCIVTVSAIVIYAACRTNLKKCAARIASPLIGKKLEWGNNDELDKLIDFGTHKKALQELRGEFEAKTKNLEDKIRHLECRRPNAIMRLPTIKLSDVRYVTHFKPLASDIAINVETASRHQQIAAFNRN